MKCLVPNQSVKLTGHLEDWTYYKLERVEIEHMREFIETYVCGFACRPILSCACISIINLLELWGASRIFRIWINNLNDRLSNYQIRVSLWHELIHIHLYVIGEENHDEKMIERTAKRLARRLPQIIQIFEEVFPELSLQSPLKRVGFMKDSITNQVIRIAV